MTLNYSIHCYQFSPSPEVLWNLGQTNKSQSITDYPIGVNRTGNVLKLPSRHLIPPLKNNRFVSFSLNDIKSYSSNSILSRKKKLMFHLSNRTYTSLKSRNKCQIKDIQTWWLVCSYDVTRLESAKFESTRIEHLMGIFSFGTSDPSSNIDIFNNWADKSEWPLTRWIDTVNYTWVNMNMEPRLQCSMFHIELHRHDSLIIDATGNEQKKTFL